MYKNKQHDPEIQYRGASASRLDNLTDAVFGIAITLLIFNLANPNSFTDLLSFTKTLPAFIISISFIVLIWKEHYNFSEVYSLNDGILTFLNTTFIALVIFYVYPLRFLTLFLTNLFFQTEVEVIIEAQQVPNLIIYYGVAAFAIYFVFFLFYVRALRLREDLQLSTYELLYTRGQKQRLLIMFSIPLLSVILTVILRDSPALAGMIGGWTYCLYPPAIMMWHKAYKRRFRRRELEQVEDLRT